MRNEEWRPTAWGREEGGDKGRRGQTQEESESMPWAEKMGATKAGGGNLHRGRGATAWGREDGGDKGRRGQTHEESESMPGAEKTRGDTTKAKM